MVMPSRAMAACVANFYFENENSSVIFYQRVLENEKLFLSVIREGVKGMVRRCITWLSGYSLA